MSRSTNGEQLEIPRHIAIVMDGNGRWAKKRFLPRKVGHQFGARTFTKVVEYCTKIGVEYLSAYAFSTENWKRPPEEVQNIMALFREYLSDYDRYRSLNTRVHFLGDLSVLDDDIKKTMLELEEESSACTGMHLNIAVNYGGRDEIVHAAKALAEKVRDGNLNLDEISEAALSDCLYTSGMPDVDLLIRPSGERRISNFLIWQCAYAEFVYMDVLWPDFSSKDMDKAIVEYNNRNRRFGGI